MMNELALSVASRLDFSSKERVERDRLDKDTGKHLAKNALSYGRHRLICAVFMTFAVVRLVQ